MAAVKNQNVKDILQSSGNKSNYEIITSEIRDFILHEKTINKQIDVGIDDFHCFGMTSKLSCPMKYVMFPGKENNFETHDKNNEQNYQLHQSFGKPTNTDKNGSKMKKLIYSSNEYSRVNSVDTVKRPYSNEECNSKESTLNDLNIYEALCEAPVSTQKQEVKACMSYLNKIRLQLKKLNFEQRLFTLRRHFSCIHKGKTMDLDEFMQILRKVNIILDPKMFCSLLVKFGLISNHAVYYDEALKLLYWKCQIPPLLKQHDLSKEWQYYRTTYQELSNVNYKS